MKVCILGGNGILGFPTVVYLLKYTNVEVNIVTENANRIHSLSDTRIKTFPRTQLDQALESVTIVYNFLGILVNWDDYLPAIEASKAQLYFLPDFGIRHEKRPDFAAMARKTDHYKRAEAIEGLKCVRLLTGAFADTMIKMPQFWGINVAEKSAATLGDGNQRFSYTFVDKIAETLAICAKVDISKLDPILEIKNGDICLNEFYALYEQVAGDKLTVSQGLSIEQAEQAIFATQKSNPEGPEYQALYGLTVGTLCNSGYGLITNKDNWIADLEDGKWDVLDVSKFTEIQNDQSLTHVSG